MRTKKDRLPEGDDGRTIVDMNVEGMPWYDPAAKKLPEGEARPEFPLTRRETLRYMFAATKAALLVALIFSAAIIAVVLFCLYVWFPA